LRIGAKNLLADAFKKAGEYPFIIFLDMHLQPISEEIFRTNLIPEISETISEIEKEQSLSRDPFELLIFTNFPYHQNKDWMKKQIDFFYVHSKNPANKIQLDPLLEEIVNSVRKSHRIPSEFDESP